MLVGTSHPGNIGAAARAMKTMEIENLRLVSPRAEINDEAMRRASGAVEVLEQATTFSTLSDAVAQHHLVVGCSARKRKVGAELWSPRKCAESLIGLESQGQRVALVFGREDSGLTNDELSLCHAHVMIPANPEYSSLNLASAVQVLAWEYREALLNDSIMPILGKKEEAIAEHSVLEGLYEHFESAMTFSGFLDPKQPKQTMAKLRRLFGRAHLSHSEVQMLRGILTELERTGGCKYVSEKEG